MSRDMKPRKTPPAGKSGGSTLLGLFIGMVIGVIGVAGVVWYINKAPLPFTTTGQQPKLPPPVASKSPTPASPETPAAASAPVALPGKPGDPVAEKPRFDFYKILPGKAEAIPDPTPEENRPAAAKAGETKSIDAKSTDAKPSESKSANSKNAEEKMASGKSVDEKTASGKIGEGKATENKNIDGKTADSTKGKTETALKEPIYLQAGSFQTATDADNQKARLALLGAEARIQQVMLQDKVWYRVRLGPYHKMEEVNHLRADLAKQGIDASVVKKD